jgi:hypothetical protein
MLQAAAFLLVAMGIAHSVLGERYILTRLFRRADLPKIFGSAEFTVGTLRFTWHLTSVMGFGLAAVLLQLAGQASPKEIVTTLGWLCVASGLLPLIWTRGRHLSWLFLFAAAGLCLSWTSSAQAQGTSEQEFVSVCNQ